MTEIILKLFGGAMICISCAMTGILYSKRGEYRINDLYELKKALVILKSEIEFAYNSLPNAFANVYGRTSPAIGNFFNDISEKINEHSGKELSRIWQDGLLSGFDVSCLQKEDIEIIARLGQIVGYLDKTLQINALNIAIDEIDVKTAELRAVCEKNKRLYRSLGILGGLLVTILIL